MTEVSEQMMQIAGNVLMQYGVNAPEQVIFQAARAALTAALAVAPKPRVKALIWREWRGCWYGSAPYMMDYEIRQRGEVFYLPVVGKNFMSLAEAKAAAKADYEARILAALEDGQ